jgi:hypothetical protein
MALAGGSKAKNRIVILDSCHSGAAGESALRPGISEVTEGMSILTASRSYQACAAEWNRKVA